MHTPIDHHASLGLSLRASGTEIDAAYRRAVALLDPNRFGPGDLRILAVNRIFTDHVHLAYTLMRYDELRASHTQALRSHILNTCDRKNLPRTVSLRRLESAVSQEHLNEMYTQELVRGCEDMYLDVEQFTNHTDYLSDLNRYYIVLSQAALWRFTNTRVHSAAIALTAQHQLMLARVLLARSQPLKAFEILCLLEVDATQQAMRHELLGKCYSLLGKPSLAKNEFETALRLDPDCSGARSGLTRLRHPSHTPA
ncbi:MAG: hypothetical protein H7Y22_06395 [Gemmatimonadaceae bacterium]|nr:hypothetical protein [Gloeobacterales cyanobacterium ES-bin-141]